MQLLTCVPSKISDHLAILYRQSLLGCLWIVVVQIFNATRHPRHIEAAAIVVYMYLYILVFMDHPCTLGATVCHHAPPCPLYTQSRAY